MTGRSHRKARHEYGVAAPASVAVLSSAAVVVAGIFYLASGGAADEPEPAPAAVPAATPTPVPPVSPTTSAEPTASKPKPKRKEPVVRRAATYVEVYNNSGIPGLAASTGRAARGAGWQVVGEDNWFGTISASTVYHPPGERAAARLLAEDLGIGRLRPAVEPMRFDRLTVILTSDYSGQGR